MVGRTSHHHDSGATTTKGGRAKGVAFASNEGSGRRRRAAYEGRAHSASLSSDNSGEDEHMNTLLSASSIANTDTVSSSGHSTAMTSATTYDDRPSAETPTATPPYAHPSLTLLELVSNTASSSALPDSFDVSVSRKGGYVAVYSSSNLFLIKTMELPRLWARTLQVKRKPVAIDITEDGFLLAVLSRPSQVDLYEIHGEGDNQIKKRRTIMLVHEASSVVVSPDARILITGNKFGIEVMAIGPEVAETTRRTLSGPAGDALEFSDDGRTLLITGYARKSDGSALFVLPGLYDGPLTEEGEPIPQPPEAAWTGSVLFPETARIARQATLLPDADTGTFNELFAFNAEEDSWGIYDIACQRFTQRKMFLPDHQRWTRSEFVDDAMPAVSPNADLAAVALRMRGTTNIWIYEVPGWEYKPSEKSKLEAPIQPCFCIPIPNDNAGTLQEICVLRWVRLNANVQRLVAVGNSSILPDENEVPGAPLGSKGVLIVLDFDKTKPIGSVTPIPLKTEYDLDPLCPGEMLPEGFIDFDREVELVRTRTMAHRRAQDRNDLVSRGNSRVGSTPVHRARTSANRNAPRPSIASDESEELTPEEAQAMFEAPYDNQQPRSQMSLARAATVAAVSPANRRHLRALPFRPLEYRRADGHRELPHESDADNWIPPPPAYTTTAAAAASVSLSHPDAPPVPRLPHTYSSSSMPPVLPLPNMSATINPSQTSPSHLYQHRQQSISSSNISSPPQPERERRPSLLHPSTYPSPQSSGSIRRRSSSARAQADRMSYTPLPTTQSIYPTPSNSTPRSPARHQTRTRHPGPETNNSDLYSSPSISSPTNISARRPVPSNAISNSSIPRSAVPLQGNGVNGDHPRGTLPPITPPANQHTSDHRFPISAPPRTGDAAFPHHPYGQHRGVSGGIGGLHRASQSAGNLLSGHTSRMEAMSDLPVLKEKGKKGKRKVNCVVM
ncbi:f-box domain-containing protein [Stemphylium lycopersici]|uniref:F-box domain-containing protein n=1 Tax=Stemphylium lycopersici TaxID=183478 RepID=A0A364MUF1_STELY|nr:f-box domain-containing protein [Stemphylium lycopersici]RAR03505.1 f-box domain-containing protein [Stemphylium lycopersici]RAR09246.1 f-box domain-containing protein [Stemphylium lycopersici]